MQFPYLGAPRPHLAPGLRVAFKRKYAIYYYVTSEDDVVIMRVLHGSRDLASIVDDGGFDSQQ